MNGTPTWDHTRCLRCGMCVGACPRGALRLGSSGISVDGQSCISCMRCRSACPTGSFGGG